MNRIIKPSPDPTLLTTEQLLREIEHLRAFLVGRLEAMDKAMVIFNENITRVPTDTDKQIQHLKELHDEKFESIKIQFIERDTRTEQTSRDSKVAVDAALQAAKEAVGEQNKSSALAIAKSEASTIKQIDQQGLLISTATKALDDKIIDLKERLTRVESVGEGKDKSHTSSLLILAVAVSLFIGLANILISVWKH